MTLKAMPPKFLADVVLSDLFGNVPLTLHDFPQESAPSSPNSAEDRGLGTTGNLNPDVLFRIHRAAHISFELDKKSDEEIAQMLLQTLWAEMHTGTLEAELVDQAITRLRKEKP